MNIFQKSLAIIFLLSAGFLMAAGPDDVYLDLDTAEGCFSKWQAADLQKATSCSMKPSLLRVRRHEKWLPAFSFAFASEDASRYVQLQFLPNDERTVFTPELQFYEKGKEPRRTRLEVTVNVKEKFELRFDWAKGRLAVEVNQKEMTSLDWGFEPATFSIACSTAELQVEHLKFK